MIRKSALAATIAALLTPAVAQALGLGNIEVTSALNEPLQARIPLRGVGSGDLEALRAGIASDAQFARAGLDRAFVLTKLNFEVVETSASSGFIRVTSRDPIAEPFLNFLVDVNWPRGRVLREYTVLLDPPIYGAAIDTATRRAVTTGTALPEGTGTAPRPGAQAVGAPTARAPSASGSPAVSGASRYSADSYGPVRAGETLWSIADRVRPGGVSIQNMMLALLRANPQAFSIDNVNALRTGAVLRIPSASEIAGDQAEAMAAVARQQALWQEYRQSLPATVGVQPGGAAVPPAAAPQVAAPQVTAPQAAAPQAGAPAPDAGTGGQPPTGELEVVGGASAGTGTGVSDDVQALRDELSLAQEEADAAKRENEELSSRLSEVETLVGDLRRLVELKEDQLAALQQQLSEVPPASTALPSETAPGTEATTPVTEATTPATEATAPAPDSPAPGAEAPAASAQPAQPVAPVPEPAPEPTPEATQAQPPRPAPPPAPPPPPMSFMDQINAMLPVPLWTVLAGLGALLFGLGGLRWARARGARNADAAAAGVAVAPALAEDESLRDQYARTELPVAGSEDPTELPASSASPDASTVVEEDKDAAGDNTDLVHGATGRLSAGPGPDEEDPLAEVNVYLAYERFDQAEQLVRDAIANYPQHHEYKLKLLEVFYAAKNVAGFEAAAHELRAAVGDEHELMQQARAWWQDLGAGRDLFAVGVASAMQATQTVLPADEDLFDVTASDSGDETGVDFDLGFDSEPGESTASSLDFDLGADDRAPGEASDGELDFDLGGFDTDEAASPHRTPAGTDLDFDLSADADTPVPASGDTGLDFDLEGLDAEPEQAGGGTTEVPDRTSASGDTGLDFDVSGLESQSDEPRAAAAGPAAEDSSLDFTLDDGEAERARAAGPAVDDDGAESGLDFDLSDTTTFGAEAAAGVPDADDDRSADLSGMATEVAGISGDDDAASGLDFDLGDDETPRPPAESRSAHDADAGLDLELESGETAGGDTSRSLGIGDDAQDDAFQQRRTEVGDGSDLDLTLDAGDTSSAGASRDDEVDFPLLDMDDDERPAGGIDTVKLPAQDADSLRSQAGVHEADGDDGDQFDVDTEFRDIFASGGHDAAAGSGSASVLDFDLGTDLGDEQVDGDEDDNTAFMLRDVPAEGGDEDEEDHTLALGRGVSGEVDEMQTKLDLAQAYMDMGDSEGARNLLGEVMAEGGDAQKDLAREMLIRLS